MSGIVKGVVSNLDERIVTHTSGEADRGSVGDEITHKTKFKIGDKIFIDERKEGENYALENGDELTVLYSKFEKGYYEVEKMVNNTKKWEDVSTHGFIFRFIVSAIILSVLGVILGFLLYGSLMLFIGNMTNSGQDNAIFKFIFYNIEIIAVIAALYFAKKGKKDDEAKIAKMLEVARSDEKSVDIQI